MSNKPLPLTATAAPRVGSKNTPATVGVLDPKPAARLADSPALRVQQAIAIKRRLAPLVRGALQLSVTDNRSVMLSVRRDLQRRRFEVRLHHLFVGAPQATVEALARYITVNDPNASQQLSAFIDENDHRVRDEEPPSRQARLRAGGRVYDLQAIFDQLNREYFDGELAAQITWGRKTAARGRRSIRLASYCLEEQLIRVHPGLDQRWVPEHYLQWVVYHEMLHSALPIGTKNGRRIFHGREFARAERDFARYEEAHAWERRNVANLLRI